MKFVKFILCVAILLSSVSGVYAAEDNGVADALRQIKERVDTSEYDDFKSSYYKDDDGTVSYSFNWHKTGNSDKGLYISFADGIIESYGKYDYGKDDEVDAFSMEEEEAVKIAKDFIKRINPEISERIVIVPEENRSIYSDTYDMQIYMTEGGIPVLDETGYISVSKSTREAEDFYINYRAGIDFKPLDNLISEEDAKAAYKKLIPPTLRYKIKKDYNKGEITAYLEYAPDDSGLAINAYDGSKYNLSYGDEIYYNNSMSSKEAVAEDGGFTPAELEETERIAGLLSEEKVTDIARKNEYVAIPLGLQRDYISLNRDFFNKGEYTYDLGFSNPDKYISVSVDAKNGEILSFNNYDYSEKRDRRNRKTEEQKAQKAFSDLAGTKATEFRMEESEQNGYVGFVRTVNGLDVIGNSAGFDFDNDDNIVSYGLSYTKNVTFPSADGVISKDEAAEVAFGEIGFELGYSINDESKTAQPVYYIGKNGRTASFMLNPFSGKLIDYDGKDLEEDKNITYSDIDGHYGQAIFEALAQYGIGFEGGELKPNEAITQAEYFVLLNDAFGYEDDIEEIYKSMIIYGTISADERADNSVLTREKAAIFMIREIGADEYAKYEDIFAAPFDDVTENKGYIGILKAKGIIKGDGSGNFYPQKTVTRGEALIMIYNCFAK